MKCYNHADVDAVATCAQCGRATCQECVVDVAGRMHCQECLAKPTTVTSQDKAVVPFNKMARTSMACGLGGWILYLLLCCFGWVIVVATLGIGYICLIPISFVPFLGWIAGIVTGHKAMKQISESGGAERGREMALAGLISGYIGVGLTLCGCLAILILTAAGVSIPVIEGLGG